MIQNPISAHRSSLLGRVAFGLLLTTFGIVLALLLIEILFRCLEPLVGATPPTGDRPTVYFVPENAKTLQDFSYEAVKPANTYRIAIVGDSFTFGPYLQFDDTFVKRLERWLNLNVRQPKVEVINYGVPRYSSNHEVAVVQRALDQQADLVILQITLNDPELKPYHPTSLLVDQSTGQVKLQQPLFRWWRSLGFVVTRIENTVLTNEYQDYFFKLFASQRSFDMFKSSIADMKRRCDQKGVPLLAVVFPLFGIEVNAKYPFFPLHQRVRETLDSYQIQSLDLAETYRGIPLERLQVIPGIDRHPNEIGHRLAAESIYSWLAATKILPEEIVAKHLEPRRIGIKFAGSG